VLREPEIDNSTASTAHGRPTTDVVVVPHTHWDREWHSPFETMRAWLVWFFDELIDAVEADPDLPVFLLDGQSVILEDYLDVRPEQRQRLTALVSAGRLRPGPFYVQPDEFLTSGEAQVRNLLVGMEVAAEHGYVLREGYLPDTFGHVAQMPAILQGFGIGTFYATRGMGADLAELGSEFWWEAPDGSRVLASMLTESYSNAAVLNSDAATMSIDHSVMVRYRSLFELLDRLSLLNRTGVLLLLNGGDHLRLQPGVTGMVRSLAAQVEPNLRLGSLEEYSALAGERSASLATYRGELRAGRYYDIFEGVTSTRTYLKQANADAESALAGLAERLDVLARTLGAPGNTPLLRYAWKQLLKNDAHDSITGCSADPVHEEMEVRLSRVRQVAEAVVGASLRHLAPRAAGHASADGDAIPVVVVNPSPWRRSGPTVVGVVPDPTAPLGRREFGWRQQDVLDWDEFVLLDEAGLAVPFTMEGACFSVEDILNRRKELYRTQLRFLASDVPGIGTRTYRLVRRADARRLAPAAAAEPHTLANENVTVIAADDGTLTVIDRPSGRTYRGLGELVDEADTGDEYTFAALSGDTARSSTSLAWRVERSGPDMLTLSADWPLPAGLTAERTARARELVSCEIRLTVTLPPNATTVRLDVTVDNRVRDHRLALRLPTGITGAHAHAETAFGVISRPDHPDSDPSWKDRPIGTYAARRFVTVSDAHAATPGLTVLTHGLHEYRHEAGDLHVTLLRGVGWLSRTGIASRAHSVGPSVETPGAQSLGTVRATLALMPYNPSAGWGSPSRAAEELALPLLAVAVNGAADAGSYHDAPEPQALLEVNPEQAVLSALKQSQDGRDVVARLYNVGTAPVTAELRWGRPVESAFRTDLAEQPTQDLSPEIDGSTVRVLLGPAQIVTVRVHLRSARPHDRTTA